jgi:Holliday junction DNA helicase RuvA
MILSSHSPEEIQQAIVTGNVSLLKSIKGIGEKTAQRIIVDLKGKTGKEDMPHGFLSAANNTAKNEALSALVMLGFAKNIAEKAIDRVLRAEPEIGVEQLVKSALKNL